MVDKNDPLIREVDEELRREQWAKLWEQYGLYAIGAAALVVALVGGYQYWESRRLALAQAGGAQYESAVDLLSSGKTEEATRALEAIAASGPDGYATLAELSLAGSHLKAGRPREALAVFEKLARDTSADALLSSYAALQAAALRVGEADVAEIQTRLSALAADDSPWRFYARELLGTAAFKAGKLDEARKALAPLLVDPKVPYATAERVRTLMARIAGAELAQTPPVAADDTAVTPAQGAGAQKEEPASAPK